MDPRKWFAKVKYQDAATEEVPIKKIKTSQGEPFRPKNWQDFDPNRLYSVKTAKYDPENKENRYYAFIGRIAETLEDMQSNRKRISWPSHWPTDEEPNNTSQDERQIEESSSVLFQRGKSVLKKVNKRVAADDFQKFFSANDICTDALTNGQSICINMAKCQLTERGSLRRKSGAWRKRLKI